MELLDIQSPSIDLVGRIEQLCETITGPLLATDYEILRKALTTLIDKITVHLDQIIVRFRPRPFAEALKIELSASTLFELSKSMTLRRRGRELKMVIGGDIHRTPKPDPSLIVLVARAYELRTGLQNGSIPSIKAFAKAHSIDHADAKRLLPLGYLAPDIVDAIINGQQPSHLTARDLKSSYTLPLLWSEQRVKLGFPAT